MQSKEEISSSKTKKPKITIYEREKENFNEEIQKIDSDENKIDFLFSVMKESIEDKKSPKLVKFWAAREILLNLFKNNFSNEYRRKTWDTYVNLSDDAKHLKTILTNKAEFEIEQIDIAVKSVENDFNNFDVLIKKIPVINFPEKSKLLNDKRDFYISSQREISLLSKFAQRIMSLRKEVIKISIFLTSKSLLLKRLSDIADKVFPKRNKLIDEISLSFLKDVQSFIIRYFDDNEKINSPGFVVKEEIKNFQILAKSLSLSSEIFSKTRKLLSDKWDIIRSKEISWKKDLEIKKMKEKEELDTINKVINEFKLSANDDLSYEDIAKKEKEIINSISRSDITYESKRKTKAQIEAIVKPFKNKHEKEKEKTEDLKRQNINNIKMQIINIINNEDDYDCEHISNEKDKSEKSLKEFALSDNERNLFDCLLRSVKDIILEKSKIDASCCKEVISMKIIQRKKTKKRIEEYRKIIGGSGLDFEKSMIYNELIDFEKSRLEELDRKIYELESNIK